MNLLALFNWDLGRHGQVSSVFICDRDELESAYGAFLDFGDFTHTGVQISGVLEETDITILSDDPDTVARMLTAFGETVVGRNPLLLLRMRAAESCFSDAY
jgi:hypothetical protein